MTNVFTFFQDPLPPLFPLLLLASPLFLRLLPLLLLSTLLASSSVTFPPMSTSVVTSVMTMVAPTTTLVTSTILTLSLVTSALLLPSSTHLPLHLSTSTQLGFIRPSGTKKAHDTAIQEDQAQNKLILLFPNMLLLLNFFFLVLFKLPLTSKLTVEE